MFLRGCRCFICHQVADDEARHFVLRSARDIVLLICSSCWPYKN
jgi:hypothetical protein